MLFCLERCVPQAERDAHFVRDVSFGNDVGFANDDGFATFYGKHRIIAERSGATSYLRSKCIISPQGDAKKTKKFYVLLTNIRLYDINTCIREGG